MYGDEKVEYECIYFNVSSLRGTKNVAKLLQPSFGSRKGNLVSNHYQITQNEEETDSFSLEEGQQVFKCISKIV